MWPHKISGIYREKTGIVLKMSTTYYTCLHHTVLTFFCSFGSSALCSCRREYVKKAKHLLATFQQCGYIRNVTYKRAPYRNTGMQLHSPSLHAAYYKPKRVFSSFKADITCWTQTNFFLSFSFRYFSCLLNAKVIVLMSFLCLSSS